MKQFLFEIVLIMGLFATAQASETVHVTGSADSALGCENAYAIDTAKQEADRAAQVRCAGSARRQSDYQISCRSYVHGRVRIQSAEADYLCVME